MECFSGSPFCSQPPPDLLVEAMAARGKDPAFAVDYNYVYYWAQYTVLRDHPELLGLPRGGSDYQEQAHSMTMNETAAKRNIVTRLEALVDSKKGEAKATTATTTRAVNQDLAYETKSKRQKPTH